MCACDMWLAVCMDKTQLESRNTANILLLSVTFAKNINYLQDQHESESPDEVTNSTDR